MAPTLFSMIFSAMLTNAFQDFDASFSIKYMYRFNAELFDITRLQIKSKVQTLVLDKLLYTADLAEDAKTETKMQGAMDKMLHACDNYDLTISTKRLR